MSSSTSGTSELGSSSEMVHIDLPEDTEKSLPERLDCDPYAAGLMAGPVKKTAPSRHGIPACCALSDMRFARDVQKRKTIVVSSSEIGTVTTGVEEHKEDEDLDLLYKAYRSISKGDILPPGIDESKIFKQKTPLGSTLLHIGAAYGNDECVRLILQKAPDLLAAKNSNGDMALHVAAKAKVANTSILKELLCAHLRTVTCLCPQYFVEALENEILKENNQGNSFIDEALLSGHRVVVVNLLSSEDNTLLPAGVHKEMLAVVALFRKNEPHKSILYMAIEAGYEEVVQQVLTQLTKLTNPALLDNFFKEYPEFEEVIRTRISDAPEGKSPLLAAIMKQDREILNLILTEIPAWIHLRDTKGRTALHYAASTGYLDGVRDLLDKCASCATKRDKDGLFPLHFASYGGHVEVVKELMKKQYCVDPREILDKDGRNFIHLAVESGKLSVVKYILRAADNETVGMINQQDVVGNTPLHWASISCHPKIVHALTWDKRVKLNLVNESNQTALDICVQRWSPKNLPLRMRLTWAALKSAGVPYHDPQPYLIVAAPQKELNLWYKEAQNMDQFKDRINTLILVSTLIVTVTFAAGFTLPGGLKSSDPGQGMAVMLHRMWFKLFVFCITISMYGAISVTVILIWAQLGDLTAAIFALDVAKHCLGVTLATLSLAFLSGVHLVISDLSWLATSTLLMSVTFILMLLLLYTLLWLPSISSSPILRLISYYPFLMFASLVEAKEGTSGTNSHKFQCIQCFRPCRN